MIFLVILVAMLHANKNDFLLKKVVFLVDAMSSFGAYRINPKEAQNDYIIASSNKNLQGVPGFAFVVARTSLLEKTEGNQQRVNNARFKTKIVNGKHNLTIFCSKGNARSLVLDLYDQWKGLETNGQFRFTPPTHVLKATKVAIDEYIQQGGRVARYEKYNNNQK